MDLEAAWHVVNVPHLPFLLFPAWHHCLGGKWQDAARIWVTLWGGAIHILVTQISHLKFCVSSGHMQNWNQKTAVHPVSLGAQARSQTAVTWGGSPITTSVFWAASGVSPTPYDILNWPSQEEKQGTPPVWFQKWASGHWLPYRYEIPFLTPSLGGTFPGLILQGGMGVSWSCSPYSHPNRTPLARSEHHAIWGRHMSNLSEATESDLFFFRNCI